MQSPGQEMPNGSEETEPSPTVPTLSVCVLSTNLAVTDFAAVIVTEHVGAAPEHTPPDQPAKVDPAAGAAVSTTT